jgi:deaminated glutathione amidase
MKTKGANILTYPSAFAVSTGKAHWEVLQRARAIENQCYVISAAQFGAHNEKRTSYGHAMAVDPLGKIIAECTEELELQIVEIDLEKIAKVESSMPCFQHRRQDIYAIEMKTVDYLKPAENQEPFMFEKYPVPRDTIFLETEYCVAFTNIRCVVPGKLKISKFT